MTLARLFAFGGIVAISLRLVGAVHWPWWLVLAPVWAPVALLLAAFSLALWLIALSD